MVLITVLNLSMVKRSKPRESSWRKKRKSLEKNKEITG
jgi:hypothetical protein